MGTPQALHDVEKYRDQISGVIRRTMIMERGFRPESWKFKGDCPESRFRTAFDGLCSQFKMYGVLWDQPLLMKPTITITAFTYEISLPRYGDYDRRRDFNWELYDAMRSIEDTIREGEKLNETRQVRDEKSLRTYAVHQKAVAAGYKGKKLLPQIIKEAELEPTTDARKVLRLRHRAEEILEAQGKLNPEE